jgi:DNA-binding XRE family transcriptional regulator
VYSIFGGIAMNNVKIGQLIFKLRTEKNMTQKSLAELLFLSDRTISKWERGVGCPDISVLTELSKIFKVDIEELLLGELTMNKTNLSHLKSMSFYFCETCKNVMTSNAPNVMKCCGRLVEPLQAQVEDDNHQITLEKYENEYFIQLDHEMTKTHSLEFVAFVGTVSYLFVKMYPEQNAELLLPLLGRGKLYYYCNNHGFYEKKI